MLFCARCGVDGVDVLQNPDCPKEKNKTIINGACQWAANYGYIWPDSQSFGSYSQMRVGP